MPNNSTDFDTEHKTLADPEESEIMPTGKDMSLCKKKVSNIHFFLSPSLIITQQNSCSCPKGGETIRHLCKDVLVLAQVQKQICLPFF